jgi:dUTP pyrophosphatase
MKLPVKRLHPLAFLPFQGSPEAAGWDLFTHIHPTFDKLTDVLTYQTGIALQIPPGYVGLLVPRSSIVNRGLRLANAVGVIDSDYRGEVLVKFDNKTEYEENWYQPGERIAQLVVVPIPTIELELVDELDDTVRGAGGFGSSGA